MPSERNTAVEWSSRCCLLKQLVSDSSPNTCHDPWREWSDPLNPSLGEAEVWLHFRAPSVTLPQWQSEGQAREPAVVRELWSSWQETPRGFKQMTQDPPPQLEARLSLKSLGFESHRVGKLTLNLLLAGDYIQHSFGL